MSIARTVLSIFTGRPRTDGLAPVSPQTIARATAAPEPARPPVRETESPAVTAMRMELQQLRLLKTPDGNAEAVRQLRESEALRAEIADQLTVLQDANESLTAELRAANTELRKLRERGAGA